MRVVESQQINLGDIDIDASSRDDAAAVFEGLQ